MPIVEFKLLENLKSKPFWRAQISELVGTAFLIFLGCGSILLGNNDDPNNPVTTSSDIIRISFTFGFTITCIVWTLGPVSGSHLNPAVSLAFVCIGKISLVRALLYIVSQCVGATLGAGILYAIVPTAKRGGLGVTGLGKDVDIAQGFGLEVILTFMLLMTICACVDEGRRDHGKGRATIPLTIGLCIIILNLMGIPYSGASLNPARSLGPAIVIGIWTAHWIYWIGPIVGGCLGALTYHFVFSSALHPEILIRQPSVANIQIPHNHLAAVRSDVPGLSHTLSNQPN